MKVLDRTEAAIFAQDERLFLGVFAGRVRTADVVAQERAIRLAARDQKNLAISWIEKDLTLGQRGRERVKEMLGNVEEHMLAWAIVIPAGGFWASIARTIASTARLLSKAKYPFRVFATLDEACAWLREHRDDAALTRAADNIQALRAELGRR